MTAADGATEHHNVTFSFVLPLWNSDPTLLAQQLEAIAGQGGSWECVAVDDGSTDTAGIELVEARAADDQRFRALRRTSNGGIAAATNDAVAAATGDWVAFCDHDDRVHDDALDHLRAAITAHPDADLIYTDEQVVDTDGQVLDVYRKPDWSPERLLGQNYLNHLVAVRAALIERIGGLDADFAPCPDREFTLRASRAARRVVHVPEILYDWRSLPGSVAHDVGAKPGVAAAVVAAAQRHVDDVAVDVSSVADEATSARIAWPAPSPLPEITDIALHLGTTPEEIDRQLRTTDAPLVRLLPVDALSMTHESTAALVAQVVRDRVVAAGPRVVTYDRRIVSVGRELRPHLRDVHQRWGAEYLGRWGEFAVAREVASLHPAGLLLDRASVLDMGGFDAARLIDRAELGAPPNEAASVALDTPLGIELTVAVLGAAADRAGRPLLWTPLAELALPNTAFALDSDIEAVIAAQRALTQTSPTVFDDRYSPSGVDVRDEQPAQPPEPPPTASALRRRLDATKTAVIGQLDLPRIAGRADRGADGVARLDATVQRVWRRIADLAAVVHRNHDPRLVRLDQLAAIEEGTLWATYAPLRRTPPISVVLPTHNRVDYLQGAIGSVLDQAYAGWQLVIVDDGSSDGTADYLAALDDDRIQVVRTEGVGAAAARNAGIVEATGEWVAFLDDDNVMHPVWLRAIAEHVGRHAEAQALYGATVRADRKLDSRPFVQFTEPLELDRLIVDNSIDLGAVAVRRDHPELRFDDSLTRFIDWDLVVRLARANDLAPLPALAGMYTADAPDRISAGSIDEPLAAMRRRFRT
ncbi:MAG: glycosyltransferase [Actinomycetota bacterium]